MLAKPCRTVVPTHLLCYRLGIHQSRAGRKAGQWEKPETSLPVQDHATQAARTKASYDDPFGTVLILTENPSIVIRGLVDLVLHRTGLLEDSLAPQVLIRTSTDVVHAILISKD